MKLYCVRCLTESRRTYETRIRRIDNTERYQDKTLPMNGTLVESYERAMEQTVPEVIVMDAVGRPLPMVAVTMYGGSAYCELHYLEVGPIPC